MTWLRLSRALVGQTKSAEVTGLQSISDRVCSCLVSVDCHPADEDLLSCCSSSGSLYVRASIYRAMRLLALWIIGVAPMMIKSHRMSLKLHGNAFILMEPWMYAGYALRLSIVFNFIQQFIFSDKNHLRQGVCPVDPSRKKMTRIRKEKGKNVAIKFYSHLVFVTGRPLKWGNVHSSPPCGVTRWHLWVTLTTSWPVTSWS